MSYVRAVAMLSCVFLVGPVLAQGKWTKLAAFPEPAEELLGASAGGKMYVFCGLAPGWKPIGMVYEYDPAGDRWTKKNPMPLASHHVAFTEYKGKIYAFGGFVLPQSGPAAWVPIDNAWEYNPASDTWRERAPGVARRVVFPGVVDRHPCRRPRLRQYEAGEGVDLPLVLGEGDVMRGERHRALL